MIPKQESYNIGFVVEYLNQAIEPMKDMIVKTYYDLYAPESTSMDIDSLDNWQLFDMASCILIDGMSGKKDADN